MRAIPPRFETQSLVCSMIVGRLARNGAFGDQQTLCPMLSCSTPILRLSSRLPSSCSRPNAKVQLVSLWGRCVLVSLTSLRGGTGHCTAEHARLGSLPTTTHAGNGLATQMITEHT
jgi:hypothetical protein